MTAEKKNRYITQILSTLGFLAIVGGTIAIYFYSNGWRLDPFKQEFIKTGVLTVESNPSSANILVNGSNKGRTPKSINLPIGNYSVLVEREGYVTWSKEITIKEEKSTPVFPWLVKNDFTKQNFYTLTGEKYIDSWEDKNPSNNIYFLTQKYDELTLLYRYTIYQYDINRAFWDLSPNPKVTFTYDSTTEVNISIDLAPNGQVAILTLKTELGSTEYIWDISRIGSIENMVKLDLTMLSGYTRSWAKSSDYLLLESDKEIVSFNLDRGTKSILLRKLDGQKYIWNTDEQGFFYILEENKENLDLTVFEYNLNQSELDGSNTKILIADIFLQKDIEYLSEYREDSSKVKYIPFKNSPESTKSVSDIENFSVNQSAKGVYISTVESSYWYDMDSDMYIIVSPYPTTLIDFSYDKMKFLFQDSIGYGVFTFEKANGDHTVSIGSKYINSLENTKDIQWLSSSNNLYYTKDNTLYLIDKDGDNNTKMLDTTNYIYTGFNYTKENIYTFSVDSVQNTISIDTFITR